MRTLLALTLLLVPAAAEAQQLRTVGDLRRAPVTTLADAMLPRGHPPIARVEFDTMGPALGGISWINFYSTARAIAHDFCVQDVIRVHVEIDAPDDARLTAFPHRIGNEEHATRYRYRFANGCDGKKPSFAIYSGPVDWGLDAVRALKTAIDQVAHRSAGQVLPFALTCSLRITYTAYACDAERVLAEPDFGTLDSVTNGWPGRFQDLGDPGEGKIREGDLYFFRFEHDGSYVEIATRTTDGELTQLHIVSGVTPAF